MIPLATRDAFALPVALDGQPAVSLLWGLSYERSESLDFSGPGAGGRGPDLDVRVDRRIRADTSSPFTVSAGSTTPSSRPWTWRPFTWRAVARQGRLAGPEAPARQE